MENGGNLEPSSLHRKDLGRDMYKWDAVRNESGVETTNHAQGSGETDGPHGV